MKFVIQRVKHASVTVEGEVIGSIDRGFLILVGIADGDSKEIADKMIKKALNLRIFEDSHGKTNLGLNDIDGSCLIISQFTLYADCRKGNRPSFIKAGAPVMASDMYDYILEKSKEYCNDIQRGQFGADMKVELLNDGPFTIVLDSKELGFN